MNKKGILGIVISIFTLPILIGCNGDNNKPSPSPTPSKTIDFSFNPASDNNLTVQTGKERTIRIAFNDSDYKSKVKSIKWENKSTSYISEVEVSIYNLSYTFSADKETPDGVPAEIDVEVTYYNVAKTSVKSCYIDVRNNLVLDADLEKDQYGYYTYKKEGTFRKGIQFKFTGTILDDHVVTYFGMSTYVGNPPYFDIGYKQSNKKVYVTAIYRKRGEYPEELVPDNEIHEYTSYKIVYVGSSYFQENDKIIVECTLTETTEEGLWAYVGNYQ